MNRRLRHLALATGVWLAVESVAVAQCAADRIKPGATLFGIPLGEHVKIEGRALPNGVLRVERLRIRDAAEQIRVESQITNVDQDGAVLHVLGFRVTVPAGARLLDGDRPLAGPYVLQVGQRVEVRGLRQSDGSIEATRIRRSPVAGTPREEIEAKIERIYQKSAFAMLGRCLVFDPAARITDERSGRTTNSTGRLRRDDDEQQIEAVRLGDWGTLGGRFEGAYADHVNTDLNDVPEKTSEFSSAFQVDVAADIGAHVQAYSKVQVLRDFAFDPSLRLPGEIRVKEANLMVRDIGGTPVSLQVGRLRLRDSREWFSDDYLDAASLVVRDDKTNIQVGMSKGISFGAGPRSRSDERQLFAVASYEFSRAFEVGTQFLARRDRTRKEQPVWSFFEVSGRVDQAVRYWGNVALRRGRRDDGTKLGGWAFDTGATLRPWDGGPSFTVSYAIGSGDRTPGDGVDNLYRQTGLEDNETRLGGVKRIQTFGELLDPELSNLRVLSVGLGWRWSAASFDAVHHVYMQDVPRTRATSSNLALRPTGQYGVFGHEVDTVLTMRLRHGVDVTMVSGFYVPTPAQSGPYRPAFFWKPQVQVYF